MRSPTAGMRVVVVAIVLLLPALTPAAAQEHLTITPVTVVDVAGGSLLADQTVLVEGNRIAAVGPAGELAVPDGATVIDGRGGYLIPGLWDMHTHVLWSSDASEHVWVNMEEGVDSWTLWKLYYGPALDLIVANGVTGIREMWGDLEIARRVREEASAGERIAPRMVVAGHEMDGPPARWPGMVLVSTPDEARDAVDSLHTAGAAFIKVRNRIRPDEYQVVAQRAQEVGIPLVGHVPWLVRATDASDAGQRSFEHLTGVVEGCSTAQQDLIELNGRILEAMARREGALADSLDDRFFALMLATQDNTQCRGLLRYLARNETWQVPTLVLKHGLTYYLGENGEGEEPLMKYIHPDWRASWLPKNSPYGQKTEAAFRQRLRLYERKLEITGMAVEEGVPIMAGSDTPNAFVFPGFGLHDELELLVEAGLSPLEALQAATINPARFLYATDNLGTVEEGKLADLVLLEANPLEGISNTRMVQAVILNGQLLERDDLDAMLTDVEQAVQE